jgi:ADP-heptose:LPS heptosyltransferase
LERIGDLIMVLPAIQAVRALAPSSEIDLVVGGWNASLARAIPAVTRVETLDAEWLSREGGGLDLTALVRAARGWRGRSYDLAINFEPDVRSNVLLSASGAGWTAGWASGGGGGLLDVALQHDPQAHTAVNARRLVESVFGQPARDSTNPLLAIPDSAARTAAARLTGGSGPIVGLHASGGRAIKQWDTDRFAYVANRLVRERRARIVLTGGPSDRPLVDRVKAALPSRAVVDVSDESDLLVLAALLERLDVFVTGDTGPMHLAAAVGTPVVAVFGPSDPARYAPPGSANRIVRVDLPCSPCNRIRRPPARCVGHTPDCLTSVSADAVTAAAMSALDEVAANRSRTGRDTVPAGT